MDHIRALGRTDISNEQIVKHGFPGRKVLNGNFIDARSLENSLYLLFALDQHPELAKHPANGILRAEPARTDVPDLFLQEEVDVFFNDIIFRMGPAGLSGGEPWWYTVQGTFLPGVKEMPAGVKVKYSYDKNGVHSLKPEFNPAEEPYQAFVHMFGDAIHAFSCFVNGDTEISAWWSNYNNLKPGEGLVHENRGRWHGTISDLLKSAGILEATCSNINGTGKEGYWGNNSEIRVVHPKYGIVLMRPQESEHSEYLWKLPRQVTYSVPATTIFGRKVSPPLEEALLEVALRREKSAEEAQARSGLVAGA